MNEDDPEPTEESEVVDPELVDRLLAQADAEELELLGPDGLLSQVTKAVLDRALDEELTDHLGYARVTRPATGRGTHGTAPRRRRCSPISARSISRCPGIGPASSNRS